MKVQGFEITETQQNVIRDHMRASPQGFTATTVTLCAESNWPMMSKRDAMLAQADMRLADRMIQAEKRAGNIHLRKTARGKLWFWIGQRTPLESPRID